MAPNLSLMTQDEALGENPATPYLVDTCITPQLACAHCSPQDQLEVDRLQRLRQVFDANKPTAIKPISHESTAVLLLSFENANEEPHEFDVATEVKKLEDVFADDYRFKVDNKVIQATKAQAQINFMLSQFVMENDKEHALLIIYYGGHGWHSSKRKNGFDLIAEDLVYLDGNELTEDTTIAWDSTEHILRKTASDILVIFDCCDSGSIKQLRAPTRTFEYLVACDRGSSTHGPGKNSFTAALIWALKNLKDKTFHTKTLLKKTKEYPELPPNQNPDLIPRYEMPEPIWISPSPPLNKSTSVEMPSSIPRRHSDTDDIEGSLEATYRDLEFESLDFRFSFSKCLSDEDMKSFAERMKSLLRGRREGVTARYVSLQRVSKNNMQKPATTARKPITLDNWRKAKNILLCVQRVKRKGADQDRDVQHGEQLHKKPRLQSEADALSPNTGASAEISHDQEPVTPMSEMDDANTDAPPGK